MAVGAVARKVRQQQVQAEAQAGARQHLQQPEAQAQMALEAPLTLLSAVHLVMQVVGRVASVDLLLPLASAPVVRLEQPVAAGASGDQSIVVTTAPRGSSIAVSVGGGGAGGGGGGAGVTTGNPEGVTEPGGQGSTGPGGYVLFEKV